MSVSRRLRWQERWSCCSAARVKTKDEWIGMLEIWSVKKIFLVKLKNPNSHSHSKAAVGNWNEFIGENEEKMLNCGRGCEVRERSVRDENGTIILMNLNLNRVWLIDWFFSVFPLPFFACEGRWLKNAMTRHGKICWLLVNPGQGDGELDKLKLSSLVFVCFFVPAFSPRPSHLTQRSRSCDVIECMHIERFITFLNNTTHIRRM